MTYMKKKRKKKDVGINGIMAKWYDKNTRNSRLDEMRRYADLVEANTKKNATVLEVAPGPGYLAIDLAKRGFHVTGVEISHDFVEIEKRNAKEAGVDIDFKQGNASDLPLPDGEFDFIICSAAFKNFKEPLQALHEMYRVLKPCGTALILDMNNAYSKKDLEYELKRLNMKGFDNWFVKLSFKTFLKSGAYTAEGFRDLILQTKFSKHNITKDGIGLNVWLYKS
ncbi:class I SAM-dependent methyltransferase [Evansella halocellulosilytica]|uniref:class I SAM-dependent methyltransferase n=1 Tax=Evansella halocellulosilytica TaxID=2011013 RepID=UPI00211B76E7|nr:class I SAM-dependent methyltransferase [Evansella halocellulosilytica]